MKKVLITGKNSYIGTSFEEYIKENFQDAFIIDTLDVKDKNWKAEDFSVYDSVFHVAGIAHSDNGKITKEKEQLYYSVNTDLSIDVAAKAKADGVKQFVFMSSAIVYGNSAPIGKEKVITKDTPVSPANCYGDSKVQAETGINKLRDNNFKVVILRSPMIYGKGSKGNYPILSKFAKKLPVFPYINNSRSMLYVENLCEFVRLMVVNDEDGLFWPQNHEYVNTSEMVQTIADVCNNKIILIKGTTLILKMLSVFVGLVNKAFGNLTYESDISEYIENYRVVSSLKESIERTEG